MQLKSRVYLMLVNCSWQGAPLYLVGLRVMWKSLRAVVLVSHLFCDAVMKGKCFAGLRLSMSEYSGK